MVIAALGRLFNSRWPAARHSLTLMHSTTTRSMKHSAPDHNDPTGSGSSCESNADAVVLTETLDRVRLIAINRPERRNCVDEHTAERLTAEFRRFDADTQLDVAVLHGVGGCFCAGYDLKALAAGGAGGDSQSRLKKMVDKAQNTDYRPMGPSMLRLSKPVIAAVSGYAVAGGLELALMCDLRVVEQSAKFGVFCRRWGVPLIDGGTIRLPKLIGLSRAMDMILTGREVNASTAFQWGLANRVVPDGSALQEAVSLARSLSAFPQQCLRVDRASALYSVFDATSHHDAFRYEFENGINVVANESVAGV